MFPTEAKRALVCMRYGIGDVVMEMPVLDALRSALPQAHITALVASPADDLLEGAPSVDEVVSIRRWGLSHRWDDGDEAARAAIAGWLDGSDFDLFLDVHHAATAVGRVVWSRGVRSLESDEDAEAAAVRRGSDAVTAIAEAVRSGWGLRVQEGALPDLHLADEDHRFASVFLSRRGIDGAAPVAVSPAASLPIKRWPADRFAATLDSLVEETGSSVLLFSGVHDAEADRIARATRYPERLVRVQALHLRKAAALLSRCALFLSNDTGLMHVAAAVGTPTVAVFGPTCPSIYRPRVPHVVAIGGTEVDCPHRKELSLHPPACWTSGHCLLGERSCVDRVEAGDVLAAAREAMSDTGAVLA